MKKWTKEYTAKHNYQYHLELKLEVLTHYGPSGKLKCSWPDCDVTDPDMLSLDHINNNGAEERGREGGGIKIYSRLRKENFPLGYQTLCHNHQWKKEIMKRQAERLFK